METELLMLLQIRGAFPRDMWSLCGESHWLALAREDSCVEWACVFHMQPPQPRRNLSLAACVHDHSRTSLALRQMPSWNESTLFPRASLDVGQWPHGVYPTACPIQAQSWLLAFQYPHISGFLLQSLRKEYFLCHI